MSYDKTHQNGRSRSMSTQSPSAPPRSTLANLLSSQRRSAVQSDKYRVQRARPFADSAHIDRAVGKRDKKHLQPSLEKGRGNNKSHQNSYQGSSQGSFSSSDRHRSTVQCRSGMSCRNPKCEYAHESDTSIPSHRVRFGSSSDSKTTINSEERPRKRSRWDVRPRFEPPPSAQSNLSHEKEASADTSIQEQHQDHEVAKAESSKKIGGFISPNKSILRKVQRSAGKADDIQQRFIPKQSTPLDVTSNKRDGQLTETSNSATAYPRTTNALKVSYPDDSVIHISHTSGGNIYSHSNLKHGENVSHTRPEKSPIAHDVPKICAELKETGNTTQSKSGEKLPKNRVNPKKSGDKIQSIRDEKIHDFSAHPKKTIKDKHSVEMEKPAHSPKSKIESQSGKVTKLDSIPKRESAVTTEDTSRLNQDSETRSKLKKKKKRRADLSNFEDMPNSPPESKREDAASPKSRIEPEGGKVMEQESMSKRDSAVPNEDTYRLKQDSETRPKLDKKKKRKKKKQRANGSNKAKVIPEPPPKSKREDPASPTSRIEPESGKVIEQESISKRESAVPNEDTSKLEQDDMARSKFNTDSKRNDGVPNNEKEIRPKSPPKSKREDAASSSGSSKKKRKKDYSPVLPFRVKVGYVVAVRFRKLADGGNSEVVAVVKNGDLFCVTDPSIESTATLKQSDVEGKNCDATNESEKNVDDKSKKGLADVSNAAKAPECASRERKEPGANGDVEPLVKEKNVTKQKSKQYEVWSAPIPGQDDGISLLGSWIRCAFPKAFIAKWQKNNENEPNSSPGRILEGSVISILGNICSQRGITVCLLVDRSSIKSLPYLQVEADDSKDAMISSSEQKRRKLEAKIRGEDKVVVRITLASVFDQRNGSKLDLEVVSQWVVRKRINVKPTGKKPTKKERKHNKQNAQSLYVGDGNDTQFQQEQNWKWIASQTACQQIGFGRGHSVPENNMLDSGSELVGEVIKMDIIPAQDGSTTLATVTIKRLWTPEQIEGGRLAHHRSMELFDSSDNSNELYFQAPVEDLIVIGKRINRHVDLWKQPILDSTPDDEPGWNFTITHSYQAIENTYTPLCEDVIPKRAMKTCHYCQRLHHDSLLQTCQHENNSGELRWCGRCSQLMGVSLSCNDNETWKGPCCTGKCDCPLCSNTCEMSIKPDASIVRYNLQNGIGQAFSALVVSLESSSPTDFALPHDTGQLSLRPSFVPITGNMKSKSYSKTEKEGGEGAGKIHGKRKKRDSSDIGTKSRKKLKAKIDVNTPDDGEDVLPECSRTASVDQLNKKCWGSSKLKRASNNDKQPFFRENARPRTIKIGKTEEKTSHSGRAARANQRRMFKSLAALGDASKKVDRLAGRDREQQLRFDKSQIHGWGVFAEEPINSGDLIIEYRGEIIGNAVADKRELEYEKAKLDDYMFRIDAYTVCDATMLGNVARYLNGSCGGNCCTQIITAGENKRIVIYAKKDIERGEELSYDYKFSLEYDPAKRIPCHCGSSECRGFMNWDKKYL
mmetsp:Transcript_2910/g.6275  ORF Transcript_2910/g.6275 Transcript_2910/m.6275 type:complete len:1508 (+) Transcript_2910:157-4680(+)